MQGCFWRTDMTIPIYSQFLIQIWNSKPVSNKYKENCKNILTNGETAKFYGWFCSFHIKIWDGGKIITSLLFKVFQAGLKHCDGLAELETLGLRPGKHRLHFWMLLRNGGAFQRDTEGSFPVPVMLLHIMWYLPVFVYVFACLSACPYSTLRVSWRVLHKRYKHAVSHLCLQPSLPACHVRP